MLLLVYMILLKNLHILPKLKHQRRKHSVGLTLTLRNES
ncbi:hypothetical protein Gotri_024762 [Gossypium trilobum]|uniref:Uncharacterized protein n=1 Tax=Gossypium trilobum TaxID=34281 RepID=A0A7J9DNB1_9ROSI|nr:hypothetical protein [Gossypium trilobum]